MDSLDLSNVRPLFGDKITLIINVRDWHIQEEIRSNINWLRSFFEEIIQRHYPESSAGVLETGILHSEQYKFEMPIQNQDHFVMIRIQLDPLNKNHPFGRIEFYHTELEKVKDNRFPQLLMQCLFRGCYREVMGDAIRRYYQHKPVE